MTVQRVFRYLQRIMTAAEVYESVTNGGASDFADVAAILNRNGPWCLIGGLAVNCYVEPVYTIDVDLVVDASWTETSGFDAENIAPAASLIWQRAQTARSTSMLQINFIRDPRYQNFSSRAQLRAVLGQDVPVASLEDVLQGKIWAWSDRERRLSKRKKDELDLIRIGEAYPKLHELLPKEIAGQLKKG